jgi:hypothetical protein
MPVNTTPVLVLVAAATAPAAVRSVAEYLCDGTADQVEINAALTDVATTGGLVQLTPGTFTCDGVVQFTAARQLLSGSGDSSTIACDGAAVATLLKANTTGLGRLQLRNLKLLQTNATAQGVGLDTSDCPNFIAANVRIENFGTGHRVVDTTNNSLYGHYESLHIFDCNNGIDVGGTQANQNLWVNPRIRPKAGGAGTGIKLVDVRGATFLHANVEPATGTGITGVSLDATCRECWFLNPWIEGNATGLSVASGVVRSGLIGGTVTANTTDIANAAGDQFVFLATNVSGVSRWSLWGGDDPLAFAVALGGA